MLRLARCWSYVALFICFQSFLFAEHQTTNNLVRVGEKIMTFEQGLPVLTMMLNGDVQQKLKALENLSYYGDRLLGTEAMRQILIIASATNAFPITDHVLKLPPEKQNEYRQKPQTADSRAEADLFNLNLFALTIVVGSGADKEGTLLKRYLESASPTHRSLGESVPAVIELLWNSGRMHPNAKKPDLLK